MNRAALALMMVLAASAAPAPTPERRRFDAPTRQWPRPSRARVVHDLDPERLARAERRRSRRRARRLEAANRGSIQRVHPTTGETT